jgi:hypothetical protein
MMNKTSLRSKGSTQQRTKIKKQLAMSPLQAVKKLTQAWVLKDPAEMSRRSTDDITEIGPAFEVALAGKRMFFRKYQDYLSGPQEVLSYKILRPRTIRLSRSLAIVHFHYRMRTRTGVQIEDSHGKESMLCEKLRGAWRVKFIHWHRDP